MRILLCEDEKPLSRVIVKILENNNYSADAVYDGEAALDYLGAGNYDAVILDVMMPKLDGISVLRRLRAEKNNIPVLILSAKSEVDDKVLGLDSGADDYLPKPFDSKELLARLRRITRTKDASDSKLSFGNLTLDRATFALATPTASFRLSNKEYQMMEYFITNPGRIFSADYLMERIWGFDSEAEINVVWVYISYLRKKLAALTADVEIRVARNVGYSLEEKK